MIVVAGVAVGLALFAAPYFAVAETSGSRPLAPLSGCSGLCAAAAAGVSAFAITVQLTALSAVSPLFQFPIWFVLFAPPAIGIAPWAAGELCKGPSPRQDQSFAAALIAAYGAAVLTAIVGAPLLIRSLCVAAAATFAYLCTCGTRPEGAARVGRPEAADYSSSISENRSLRGSSFCWFCGAEVAGCAPVGCRAAGVGGAPTAGPGAPPPGVGRAGAASGW